MGDTACGSSEGAGSLRRIEKHRASRGEPEAPATIRGGGDVAELVDASDLKSEGLGRPGSIPGIPTSLGLWAGLPKRAAACLAAGLLLGAAGCVSPGAGDPSALSSGVDSPVERLEVDEAELRDRIRGAWLGQMIGVTWGFPTEFYALHLGALP